jgi:hypothetical protein
VFGTAALPLPGQAVRLAAWLQDLSLGRVQPKPLLQAEHSAESFGVEFRSDGLPVDGRAICYAINTKTLVNIGLYVRPSVSEPYGSSVVHFVDLNEAVPASSDLKCLESFHDLQCTLIATLCGNRTGILFIINT